jgi:hypothetical protein
VLFQVHNCSFLQVSWMLSYHCMPIIKDIYVISKSAINVIAHYSYTCVWLFPYNRFLESLLSEWGLGKDMNVFSLFIHLANCPPKDCLSSLTLAVSKSASFPGLWIPGVIILLTAFNRQKSKKILWFQDAFLDLQVQKLTKHLFIPWTDVHGLKC